jgi:NAD(P)-dependent dehydrogenase (short-subunit alcohol dehydrogenase family)
VTSLVFHGAPPGALVPLLAAQGFAVGGDAPRLLIALGQDGEPAIQAATTFAGAQTADEDSLVVTILSSPPHAGWQQAREMAVLWAFTRHAALAWAPRRVRVNALGLNVGPVPPGQPAASAGWADVAASIAAMWRLRSMTGQLLSLGGGAA